jgi:hypothetical protein
MCSVFKSIENIRPTRLFLVADGPKNEADAFRCANARAIVGRIDWKCDVHRLYAESNLGMMRRIPTGLDWVFGHTSEAIILEDDCVPTSSFFLFCQELLQCYRDDERVMEITGSNYQLGRVRTRHSYYFSRYFGIWGWATWRRAWVLYDVALKAWPALRKARFLEQVLVDPVERAFWHRRFEDIASGYMQHTWDWQWQFALWAHRGLSIVPALNLVTNIGFAPDGTTLKHVNTPVANLPRFEMSFPLEHPSAVFSHAEADRFAFDHFQGGWRWRGWSGHVRRLRSGVMRRLHRARWRVAQRLPGKSPKGK